VTESSAEEAGVARKYDMAGRTAAMQHTREAILDAAVSMADTWYDEVTLADVAARAGVSQQTVVNHFGSKLNLYLAAIRERFAPEVVALRETAQVGRTDSIVDAVLADYEVTGDRTWRLVCLAQRHQELQPVLAGGRRAHREFVEQVFAPLLAGGGSAARAAQVTALVVLLDVTTWWQLRRAEGLSKRDARRHLLTLIDALLGT
jgi:AcrR family transcriptional regulator